MCHIVSRWHETIYDNGVVLTEGFDGVVLAKYFAQVAKWRKWKVVPLNLTVKKDLE